MWNLYKPGGLGINKFMSLPRTSHEDTRQSSNLCETGSVVVCFQRGVRTGRLAPLPISPKWQVILHLADDQSCPLLGFCHLSRIPDTCCRLADAAASGNLPWGAKRLFGSVFNKAHWLEEGHREGRHQSPHPYAACASVLCEEFTVKLDLFRQSYRQRFPYQRHGWNQWV